METTIRFHLINSIPSLSITEEPKIESYINLQTIYYVLTLKKTNLQQTFMKKLKHSKVLNCVKQLMFSKISMLNIKCYFDHITDTDSQMTLMCQEIPNDK